MARATGLPGSGKRPSYVKNITTYVRNGQLIFAKFRKATGRPKSAITREQNEWFRQANILAKYAPSDDQWMAIEVAKDGPWYPRDLLMSAMRGRLFPVLIVDGQEYKAVAVREDISSDLDFVGGTVEGTILVRGPTLWQALVPGTAGEQLTSNGPATLPSWSPAGGAGRQRLSYNVPKVGFAGASFASKGYSFAASLDFAITAVGCIVNVTDTHEYQGFLLKYTAANLITEVIAKTDIVVATATGRARLYREFSAPALVEKGEWYILGWGRTDGTDTFATPLQLAALPVNVPGLAVEWFVVSGSIDNFANIAKADPMVGDTVTPGTGGGFYIEAMVIQ